MGDRSLKQEMREAVRGDRERAEARRKAEAEGGYTGPKPPTLDLNKPTREWKLPTKPAVEVQPTAEVVLEFEGEPAELGPAKPPAAEPQKAEPLRDPPDEQPGLFGRLRSLFR